MSCSCAACGNASSNLKTCKACKSVQYCNVSCQRAHRPEHRKGCKRIEKDLKVVAERDAVVTAARLKAAKIDDSSNASTAEVKEDDTSDLFNPPPKEECPICFLPFPNDEEEQKYQPCCGKILCAGCIVENQRVIMEENAKREAKMTANHGRFLPLLEDCCPFCREPLASSHEEHNERIKKRMALNDPWAFYTMSCQCREGAYGHPRDERKSFELCLRAVELGSIPACYNLSCKYREGLGVERDLAKYRHYTELAAKRGDVNAWYNLGNIEYRAGNCGLALKHWMVAAKAGDDDSLNNVMVVGLPNGALTEDEYAAVLQAHKDSQEAEKSQKRERAKALQA